MGSEMCIRDRCLLLVVQFLDTYWYSFVLRVLWMQSVTQFTRESHQFANRQIANRHKSFRLSDTSTCRNWENAIRMQESPRHKRFLVGCMQLTLHATRRTPHGASRLVLAMSAWSVKTRRAPSRNCRDASVYGRTTTAMHDNDKVYTALSPHGRERKACWLEGEWLK